MSQVYKKLKEELTNIIDTKFTELTQATSNSVTRKKFMEVYGHPSSGNSYRKYDSPGS